MSRCVICDRQKHTHSIVNTPSVQQGQSRWRLDCLNLAHFCRTYCHSIRDLLSQFARTFLFDILNEVRLSGIQSLSIQRSLSGLACEKLQYNRCICHLRCDHIWQMLYCMGYCWLIGCRIRILNSNEIFQIIEV